MARIKWFFGEFLVVVCGVLVAFILNSWWISIKETKQEQKYLKQIGNDISETISKIDDAVDSQTNRCKSAVVLIRAVYSKELPSDSVLSSNTLSCMSFDPGSQVSATLASLVNTGDIQLISDDSLRAALVLAIDELERYDKQTLGAGFSWMISSYEAFANEVSPLDIAFSSIDTAQIGLAYQDSLVPLPPPHLFKRPEKVNWQELLARESFKRVLSNLYIAHQNLLRLHIATRDELKVFQTKFARI